LSENNSLGVLLGFCTHVKKMSGTVHNHIGYPTGLKNEITLFGFQNVKSTGMPLGVKTRGNDAA
jgi:hypothetical protein